MSNYNTQLQSNNTDLQTVLQILQTKAAGGEQATPIISVSSNGLITATAGAKTSTHQLAFQAAKTITPSTASQIVVSGGYYTGGNITVAAVPTQTKSVTPKATTQNVTPDSGKFLSKVTVNGDSNLVAGNIKSGVSIFGVSGTLVEGGGSSSGEQVDWSANEDAMVTGALSSYFNDRVTHINRYAFCYCTSLVSVSFPICTFISSAAFMNCTSLKTADFPAALSTSSSAFEYCTSLTSVNFPVLEKIGGATFMSCTKLSSVDFPAALSAGQSAFRDCAGLKSVNFPMLKYIGTYAFYNCTKLSSVSFPAAETICSYAFERCFSLPLISFPAATIIYNCAFSTCQYLSKLYLTGSSICILSNSNAFVSTPIGGYSAAAKTYGSIYVPQSLLTSYQTATNWTYFSSRFVGI